VAHSCAGDADVRGAGVAVHDGLGCAVQRGLGAAAGSNGVAGHLGEVDIAAMVAGEKFAGGGKSGPLRPPRGQRVHGAQSGGDRGPVAIARWRTIDRGLHNDAVYVTAPVQRRNGQRHAQAMAGQVVQQRDLPVQAGRSAAGPAGHPPLRADPDLHNHVAVPAAERPDHRGPAPRSEKLVHPTIVQQAG
jgi:hypothetical protein